MRIISWVRGIGFGLFSTLATSHTYATPPDPALFGQLPSVHDAALSPNGKRIALLQNNDGQYVVNLLDIGTLKSGESFTPKLVALDKGVKPDFIKWTSNDRVVVSVWESKKYNQTPLNMGFLHSIDAKTLDTIMVVHPGGDLWIRQFNNRVLDWLEDDPEHIVMEYAGQGTNGNEPSVWRVRVDNGKSKLIRSATRGVNHWITDAAGEPMVGVGYRNDGEDAMMRILDPETGDWEGHERYPGLDPDTMSVISVIDEGRALIIRARRDADTHGLHRYDLVDKAFTETIYQNEEFDVGGVLLSKDGQSIVGASFTGDAQQRVLFDDYDTTFEEALAQFEGFDVQFVDQSQDADQLLLRISGPSEPGYLYLYERGGAALPLLGAMAGLSSDNMGEVISVRYKARDGARIPAYVTVPRTVTGKLENLPFIILPHGGPFSRDAKQFDWLSQFFASQGYAVLQMNFRGSSGYGKAFADAGRDSWVLMQQDVEDGMRWLLEKGYADPDRSCIAGWSYGGYSALMGAATDPDLYECVIAIAALADIPEAISDARKYAFGKARAERTFGPLMDDSALMKANNPVDRASDISVPVFMAHGRLDTSVEYDQFIAMRRNLERAGVDGTYLGFENEDHYMSTQANRQEMLSAIARFLEKVNGPSPLLAD